MMKRLLIITVLIFGVLAAFGQKNVSDKEKEAAPKTALIEAQKDYQKAVKEKNSPLLIQSLIRQIKYQSLIDMDSIPPMLQNLEEYIETDQNIVEKSILHSLLAELYQMYFNTQQGKATSTVEHQSRVTYPVICQNGQVTYIEKKYSNTHWMR